MKKVVLLVVMLVFAMTLTSVAQESNNGKKIWAKSYLNQKAPELAFGEWISAKPELKGKFILIDFWATWCGPCRRAIPEMNKFAKKFPKEVVVVALSDEPKEKVLAMKEPVIEYPSATDTAATLKKIFDVQGIPHAVLIDPQGIVRWEGFPMLEGYELTEEILAGLIQKYGKK